MVTVKTNGFTLIELLVVFSLLALLVALASPRYFASMDRSRESALKHNLAQMRESIDKFYGDRGSYPLNLEELVTKKYLRHIPDDPITATKDWVVIVPDDQTMGGVFDVKIAAPGQDEQGKFFRDY